MHARKSPHANARTHAPTRAREHAHAPTHAPTHLRTHARPPCMHARPPRMHARERVTVSGAALHAERAAARQQGLHPPVSTLTSSFSSLPRISTASFSVRNAMAPARAQARTRGARTAVSARGQRLHGRLPRGQLRSKPINLAHPLPPSCFMSSFSASPAPPSPSCLASGNASCGARYHRRGARTGRAGSRRAGRRTLGPSHRPTLTLDAAGGVLKP